jgi:glyoxylase-like metal-dependent hydrolase (beta-lactamase superfamily II)
MSVSMAASVGNSAAAHTCRAQGSAAVVPLVRLVARAAAPTTMANPLESELHYPFGDTLPQPGQVLDVADGVRWLRMRLPFALDHINLWLLRDHEDTPAGRREGWAIVDCGIDNAETRAAWQQVFESALLGLPVLRVICTHMHPDHIGLAHWLTETWGCRLWISATDWNAARVASSAIGDAHSGEHAAAFYARNGMADDAALAKLRARSNYYASMVRQVPGRFRRLMHGMRLRIGGRDWSCIAGYGHAPEHIALFCPALNTLISGDMVLPRISTNISVWDIEPEADPLPLYLDSIAAMRSLPAETLVLPSHGKPFTGLHRRIEQLRQHHDARLAEVLQACAQAPCSAAELLPLMFKRELDAHQITFAIGEAVAHVHALAGDGRLRPVHGSDGVLRYAAA